MRAAPPEWLLKGRASIFVLQILLGSCLLGGVTPLVRFQRTAGQAGAWRWERWEPGHGPLSSAGRVAVLGLKRDS